MYVDKTVVERKDRKKIIREVCGRISSVKCLFNALYREFKIKGVTITMYFSTVCVQECVFFSGEGQLLGSDTVFIFIYLFFRVKVRK